MGNFGFQFFGDVIMSAGFCLFGALHRALGPNARGIFLVCLKTETLRENLHRQSPCVAS